MRVIAVSHLKDFWQRWPAAELPLRTWIEAVRGAGWTKPTDITAQFAAASVLKSRRVVFNIKGNDYRLAVAVAFRFGVVYVKFIGTHAEYDRIDADTVEMP
jgi:mRNA interferase HigB